MIDRSLLRVANTPHTEFLLQAELKAIQDGLQYKEREFKVIHEDKEYDGLFKGYVNQDDQKEGPGIRIISNGQK
jgi:paraquat-inducible protein B